VSSRGRPEDYRRLVVKIGSALLTAEDGALDRDWLEALAADLAGLRAAGHQVIVVSSGAVALGSAPLGLAPRRSRLEQQQAAAAVGQVRLAHAWQSVMAAHGVTVAQVLVTPEDTEDRRRHLNARGTLETLLELGAMPVINENDTVATDELRYGDNDRLAARVAQMISADGLVLLSDIDGLYTQLFMNLPAVLLGGLESITGALIGGLLLGLTEDWAKMLFSGDVAENLAPYVVLMVVLVLRPEGLFGEKRIERI